MDHAESKYCADKQCGRYGRRLPLSEFSINKALKGGYNASCKECTRRRNAAAYARAKNPTAPPPRAYRRTKPRKKLTDEERVLKVLTNHGPLQFKDLRTLAGLKSSEQLSSVLARIHGSDKPVISKNGTGPRVYFLNPNPKPMRPVPSRATTEPPLSFSTISFLYPVIGGRR